MQIYDPFHNQKIFARIHFRSNQIEAICFIETVSGMRKTLAKKLYALTVHLRYHVMLKESKIIDVSSVKK